jgi:signal transduction histidine kinase/CheY-like chemotaxis protein
LVGGAQDDLAGLLVVGLSPRLDFDDAYRGFLDLVAQHISQAIATAAAYEAERRRAEALAEIDRAKTVFFSNVSHEFRTPLSLILGPTEEALRSPEQALRGEDLVTVHRNELRLLKLVNTLLDFSRIEAGRIEARYEPADIGVLTRDLASVFRSAVERAGLTLEIRIEPDLPEIWIDRDMWEKIVLNLLSNALKHTFEGSIGVAVLNAGSSVEVVVSDTGVGIAPEYLPRIFERFHRVPAARARTHEGTGIGLALVSELVRLHHGSIGVESRVGAGTTFRIVLPAGADHVPAEHRAAPGTGTSTGQGALFFVEEARRWLPDQSLELPAPVQANAAARERYRILVADDNGDMRGYLARLLAPGFIVETAVDGLDALERFHRTRPDVVLADIMMPRLDGLGLLEAIRREGAGGRTPVVLLSARAGEEARIQGLEAGADDYLVKPFSARELLSTVRAHARLAKQREEFERRELALREKAEASLARSERAQRLIVSLNDATRSLTDPDQVIWEIVSRVGRHFGASRCGYGEVDDAGQHLHVARDYTDGVASVAGRHRLRDFSPGLVTDLERGVTLAVPDVTGDPRTSDEDALAAFGALETRAVLSVPLVKRRRLAAVFTVHQRETRHWSRDDVALMEQLAERTWFAVEHARSERAIEAARDNAEAANRLKDQFLATLSHELRTPLNAILGYARLLRTHAIAEEKRQRAIEVIERNATAQNQLIEDLLDISRITTGKVRLETEPIPVAVPLGEALDGMRPAIEAKRLTLEIDADPFAGIVMGDSARLQQVFWNLLSNAVKFTGEGGRIAVTLRREAGSVVVAVRDTGAGIAPEFLPCVFDMFRQGDARFARLHGGLGLGLAICRELVELHGGAISASSAGPGQGATFTVRLPRRLAEPSAREWGPRETRPHDPGPAPHGLQGPTPLAGVDILLVDDEPDTLELFRDALEGAGASVRVAANADAALREIDHAAPDLFVTDLGLPGLDGYGLLRAVRARGDGLSRIPAVAVTAYARLADRTRALAAGFQAHVAKPIAPDALIRALVEALNLAAH